MSSVSVKSFLIEKIDAKRFSRTHTARSNKTRTVISCTEINFCVPQYESLFVMSAEFANVPYVTGHILVIHQTLCKVSSSIEGNQSGIR